MYCKYGAMNNPIGVQVMGPVHGVLFVIYCIAALRLAREARWSLAVTALGASGELERASRMLAVARLAHRVYQARLKALESKIARDSEPRPGGDPTEGFRRHQSRLEQLLAGGPERIAQEFGVNLSADVSADGRGDAG
jgi:hypothetical protein